MLFKNTDYSLKKLGIDTIRETNQIANYALVAWDDNIATSDASPNDYWPKYAARFAHDKLAEMTRWHALPADWWAMEYSGSLRARRPVIASVIRDGFMQLGTGQRPLHARGPAPVTA